VVGAYVLMCRIEFPLKMMLVRLGAALHGVAHIYHTKLVKEDGSFFEKGENLSLYISVC
jgi:hypothetical protein